MTLHAPFYLAVGSCVLEDGTGDTPYHVQSMQFPEPAPDGQGGFANAVRTIGVRVEGTTAALLATNIAALRRQAVRDNFAYLKPTATSEVGSCRIINATVVEAQYEPLRRAGTTATVFSCQLTITLETTPHWLLPWGAEVDASSGVNVPGHFDVTDPGGEDDALMSIRAVPTRDGRGLYISVKPDPGTGYDYLDDYGASGDGTSDANASGLYKKGAVADATLSADVTAPTFDTNANRGPHIVLWRGDSTATTPASNSVKARVTTTGNAIASSSSVDAKQAVAFTANDLIGYELGTMWVPACGVPDIATGSGWSAEAAQAENTVEDGTTGKTLTAEYDAALNNYKLYVCQSFASFAGQITAIEYRVRTAPSVAVKSSPLQIRNGADAVQATVNLSESDLAVGLHKITLPVAIGCASGETWSLNIMLVADASFTFKPSFSNGDYAAGALSTPYGSGEAAGDDLTFKVYGQTMLGFNTSMPILTACTESSNTIAHDYTQRIPSDFACLAYRLAASGSLGIFYDGDTDTCYGADADGIGPAVMDKVEVRKPLRFKPGVTNRVVLGILQEDAAVAGFAALKYKVRKRYLTAAW